MAPLRSHRLSVVVPVFQVEEYLESTLRSVLDQRLPRGIELEVICVDDGSTDGSAEILDRFTDDPAVQVRHQDNAGLGAARNIGVSMASGDLLAFCDSDDDLPPDAYLPMVRSLRRSGSAMAVGALVRDDAGQQRSGPLMRLNHAEARRGITVVDQPLLLADVFAVNKVFVREFWDDVELAFPVGTRYEDQPTLTRAMLAAPAIDVLTEVVYAWRTRHDGSSITQGRADLADLQDRVRTKRDSTAMVVGQRESRLVGPWFRQILPVDMWEYFRAATTAGDEYWSTLRDCVREFWNDDTVPFDRTSVPVQQRLMGYLVAHDRRADLAELIAFIDEHGVPVRDGVFGHPWQGEAGLPDGVSVVEP